MRLTKLLVLRLTITVYNLRSTHQIVHQSRCFVFKKLNAWTHFTDHPLKCLGGSMVRAGRTKIGTSAGGGQIFGVAASGRETLRPTFSVFGVHVCWWLISAFCLRAWYHPVHWRACFVPNVFMTPSLGIEQYFAHVHTRWRSSVALSNLFISRSAYDWLVASTNSARLGN